MPASTRSRGPNYSCWTESWCCWTGSWPRLGSGNGLDDARVVPALRQELVSGLQRVAGHALSPLDVRDTHPHDLVEHVRANWFRNAFGNARAAIPGRVAEPLCLVGRNVASGFDVLALISGPGPSEPHSDGIRSIPGGAASRLWTPAPPNPGRISFPSGRVAGSISAGARRTSHRPESLGPIVTWTVADDKGLGPAATAPVRGHEQGTITGNA